MILKKKLSLLFCFLFLANSFAFSMTILEKIQKGKVLAQKERFKFRKKNEVILILADELSDNFKIIHALKTNDELLYNNSKIAISYDRWNSFNTSYQIEPENYFVAANKLYLKPKNKVVVYCPFSSDSEEFVEAGQDYLANIIDEAYQSLVKKHVYSRWDPSRIVTDALEDQIQKDSNGRFTLKDLVEAIILIEHIDPEDLKDDPTLTYSKNIVYATLAANQADSYYYTTSNIQRTKFIRYRGQDRRWHTRKIRIFLPGARGLAQFMKGTYNLIVSTYPEAHLIKKFDLGSSNHLNVIQAEILLFDLNTVRFNRFNIDEAVAAYNCGFGRVLSSQKECGMSWQNCLPKETQKYLKKFKAVLQGLEEEQNIKNTENPD